MLCPHCQADIAGPVRGLGKLEGTTEAVQEAAMLDALREAGPAGVTTDDFRAMGVYQVSARIFGLRRAGADVHTELYNGVGADGVWHCRMARYRLASEPLLPLEVGKARQRAKSAPGATNREGAAC